MIALAPVTRAQVDNFNDGDDAGWQRYSPFDPFGAPATFSFPTGAYRLRSAPSPSPASLGPSRAASLLAGAPYTDFRVTSDLLGWATDGNRLNVGVVARINSPGLGSTTGYALTYSPDIGDLTISVINGEVATILTDANLIPNSANQFRLVFEGSGSSLAGRIYDLANLATPLASITTTDGTYAGGLPGLLVFDSTSAATGTHAIEATFDNFSVGPVPEPSSILSAAVLAGVALVKRRPARAL